MIFFKVISTLISLSHLFSQPAFPPQFAFISELYLLMSDCTKLVISPKTQPFLFRLFSGCDFKKQKIEG